MYRILILLALVPLALQSESWRPSTFDIRSWNHVVPADTPETCVFSPIGFAISVAMLGEGTGGNHRADIADALGLLSDFGIAFSHIFKNYADTSASNAVNITVAPSLWTRSYRKLDLDYRHSLQKNFEAETGDLSGVLPVNAWTEAKTDGRIPEILPAIDPAAEVLLLNAVAFEGAWLDGFDPARTAKADFRRDDGTTVKIPLMHGEMPDIVHVRTARFEAVRLPFAAPSVSLLVMRPKEGVRLADFRREFGDKVSLDETKALFRVRLGQEVVTHPLKIVLPRLETRSFWDLMPAMAKFKVPVRGYARIGEDFHISGARQTAYVRLAETGYSLTPGVVKPVPEKKRRTTRSWRDDEDEKPAAAAETFALDRPFVWFVWDERTDTLILSGQFTGR